MSSNRQNWPIPWFGSRRTASGADAYLPRLKEICERIAEGHYNELDDLFDMTSATNAPQIVNELAEAFASMAVQVEAREFRLNETLSELNESNRQLADAQKALTRENATLKQEMTRLRIEIDYAKRDKEVSEIAESDYFQTLRNRAQEMRGRFKPGSIPGDEKA